MRDRLGAKIAQRTKTRCDPGAHSEHTSLHPHTHVGKGRQGKSPSLQGYGPGGLPPLNPSAWSRKKGVPLGQHGFPGAPCLPQPTARAYVPGRAPLTFAGDAVWGSPIKNHPFEERVVVDILLRPRGCQAAALAALLLAEVGLVEDLAAAVPRLPEPAVPSCGGTRGGGHPHAFSDRHPRGTTRAAPRAPPTLAAAAALICPLS